MSFIRWLNKCILEWRTWGCFLPKMVLLNQAILRKWKRTNFFFFIFFSKCACLRSLPISKWTYRWPSTQSSCQFLKLHFYPLNKHPDPGYLTGHSMGALDERILNITYSSLIWCGFTLFLCSAFWGNGTSQEVLLRKNLLVKEVETHASCWFFFFFLLFLRKHMFRTFRLCEMEYGLSLLQSGRKQREEGLLKELDVKVRKVLYTMNRFPLRLLWGGEVVVGRTPRVSLFR